MGSAKASPPSTATRSSSRGTTEKDSHLSALDAKTGEVEWGIDRDEPTAWVTPLVIEAAGKTQVILNGTNRSRGCSIDAGELIWECGGQVTNPISTAVVYEDLVYCMTGHRGSAIVAIPLDATGDITDTDKIAGKPIRAPVRPVAAHLRRQTLLHQGDQRRPLLPRSEDGRTADQPEALEGVENIYASPVGADEQDLHHRPRRHNGGHPQHGRARHPRHQHRRRTRRRLPRDRRQPDLHPRRSTPLIQE